IVTVGGTGGLLNQPARITVATQAHLGNNPSIGATAGSATLTVNAGGEVIVTGTTRVGDPQGVGSGTLTVNTGGLYRTGALVASDAGGFLNLLGGELHVMGGTLAVRNDVLVLGSSPAGSPVLALDQGAACTLGATAAPFEALTIGDSHSATLSVLAGSALTISAGDVVVGNTSGGQGVLEVREAESRLTVATTGTVVIGDAGQGTVRVQQGATATTGPVSLGRASGSGLMLVDGPGSRWTVTGSVAVGGTPGAAACTGEVTLSGGGTLSVTTPNPASTGLVAWGVGDSLSVGQDASLTTNGVVLIADGASLTLSGGRISAHKLQLMGNSRVYAVQGIIEGETILAAGSSTMELAGDLTLRKNPAGRLVISNSGLIEIGGRTLLVAEDPGQANNNLNRCHLGNGGRLESAFSLQVGFTATLSGSGTVDAPIVNLGTIDAEGGGLTFTRMLEGVGHSIEGTRIILGAGGGFTGSGGFSDSTQVLAHAGSVIRATGALQMGATGSTAGFSSAGRIEIPVAAAVTLRDADGARVHDVAFMETDTFMPALVCANGLTVTGTVTGTGLLGGDANSPLAIGGTVSPSGAAGGAGEVRFSGDTALQGTARLVLDIFGHLTSDRIILLLNTVDGGGPVPTPSPSDLALAGTLEVRVAPGHTPSNGERHQLIRVQGQVFPAAVGQVFGDFDAVDLPPKWQYQIVSSTLPLGSNGVFVKFCAADFNNDRAVDPDDLSDYIACFFAVPPCPDADINGDGNADPDDLSDFIGLFFSPCG
ncbi:MAG: hypothetical protein JNK35_04785, partial [Phycisphaerae bacterium]|nr:hypothetical protein [Phycisphaerae bacterium]